MSPVPISNDISFTSVDFNSTPTPRDENNDRKTPQSVGDVNGDGRDDMLVADYNARPNGWVHWLPGGSAATVFGEATAAFRSGANIDALHAPGVRIVSLGDMNVDGYSDFAMVNAAYCSTTWPRRPIA